MTQGGVPAAEVMSVFSVVADALTRKALDLTVAEAGEAPARFTWLTLGQPGPTGGGAEFRSR